MKYIALLRGINVGTSVRVEMKRLRSLFESLGFLNVATYINSGNVIFESDLPKKSALSMIQAAIENEFGVEIPVIVKTQKEMAAIASAIPDEWRNDTEQKTDVAYLFDDIDSPEIIEKLPVKREFIDIRYVKGAIFWNVSRENYNRSHLNKIISHKLYRLMTVRNVNTARFLAGTGKNYKP
ncbi:MAG TPA: DUF1697 domain-containing protein [bacterium]|nr:DUF1697 domain-containing protein [bacterium]